MKLSIIIPVFNEQDCISCNIQFYKNLEAQAEVIFVDGNSTDKTISLLQNNNFQCIESASKGRGAQLYAGLFHVKQSEAILFLHADTKLPDKFSKIIAHALDNYSWGRFDIKIESSRWIFRVIERLMNLRSCITGIATGDQAIFIKTDIAIQNLDNLADYPLMEDIYMSMKLKALGRPACINTAVITSPRYWEKHGILKTIINMWRYRLLFYFGTSQHALYDRYYN